MSAMTLGNVTVRSRHVLGWNQVRQCLATWIHRARSRDGLRCLDYSSLRDIGISSATAD